MILFLSKKPSSLVKQFCMSLTTCTQFPGPLPLVLQVQKCRNVSAPKSNQEDSRAPPLLLLTLTDGHSTCSAVYDPRDMPHLPAASRNYNILSYLTAHYQTFLHIPFCFTDSVCLRIRFR